MPKFGSWLVAQKKAWYPHLSLLPQYGCNVVSSPSILLPQLQPLLPRRQTVPCNHEPKLTFSLIIFLCQVCLTANHSFLPIRLGITTGWRSTHYGGEHGGFITEVQVSKAKAAFKRKWCPSIPLGRFCATSCTGDQPAGRRAACEWEILPCRLQSTSVSRR